MVQRLAPQCQRPRGQSRLHPGLGYFHRRRPLYQRSALAGVPLHEHALDFNPDAPPPPRRLGVQGAGPPAAVVFLLQLPLRRPDAHPARNRQRQRQRVGCAIGSATQTRVRTNPYQRIRPLQTLVHRRPGAALEHTLCPKRRRVQLAGRGRPGPDARPILGTRSPRLSHGCHHRRPVLDVVRQLQPARQRGNENRYWLRLQRRRFALAKGPRQPRFRSRSVAGLGIPLHYQPIDTAPRRRLPPHLVRLAPGSPFRTQVLRHRHRPLERPIERYQSKTERE